MTTSGLISTSERRVSTKRASSAVDERRRPWPQLLRRAPSPNASLRAWKPARPTAGSIASRRIFSGVFAATSSISTPPSGDAMTSTRPDRAVERPRRGRARARCRSPPRRAPGGRPCPRGPVWCVTSVLPRIFSASRARLGRRSCTTLTPPPLPRPPAWICALTTTTGVPSSFAAASRLLGGRSTTLPRGTGTPYAAGAPSPGTRGCSRSSVSLRGPCPSRRRAPGRGSRRRRARFFSFVRQLELDDFSTPPAPIRTGTPT